jgi:hypothetical protein
MFVAKRENNQSFVPFSGPSMRIGDPTPRQNPPSPSLAATKDKINYLHLDGLYTFASIIGSYGYARTDDLSLMPSPYVRSKNSYFLKAHLWCRLTILIQTVALIIFNFVKHVFRGAIFLVEGVITFDFSRIRLGIKDLLSAVVETIALPIFGVFAIFSPSISAEAAYYLGYHLNPSATAYLDSKKCNYVQLLPKESDGCYDVVRGFVCSLIERCTAPVSALAYAVSLIIQDLFALNWDTSTLQSVGLAMVSPVTFLLPRVHIERFQGICTTPA